MELGLDPVRLAQLARVAGQGGAPRRVARLAAYLTMRLAGRLPLAGPATSLTQRLAPGPHGWLKARYAAWSSNAGDWIAADDDGPLPRLREALVLRRLNLLRGSSG